MFLKKCGKTAPNSLIHNEPTWTKGRKMAGKCRSRARDRHASFEPQIVPKHQTRWTGFDDKILSLYARGMTVREIQGHLQEMYGAEVSPSLISTVTDAVMDEAKAWQGRPLEALYPIVYLDCIHVKTRDSGAARAKAVYLALGINMAGEKEILGPWIAQTEWAKVLAAGGHGAQEPGRGRYLHRLRGWLEGVS
jgi:transposase-like protein